MRKRHPSITRRNFIEGASAAVLALPAHRAAAGAEPEGPHQATGTRVGEVTATSALVWTRLTRHPQRNHDGVVFATKVDRRNPLPIPVPVEQIEGACPGMAGSVRLRYGLMDDFSDAAETGWVGVSEATDFIHAFRLEGLKPDSTYHYLSQAMAPGGRGPGGEFRGKFCTAPTASTPGAFRFCVMTCQGYPDRDHPDGHPIY